MTPPPRYSMLIIGTGFAGLGMAIRLKQSGWHDFVVLEKSPQIGGTWRDNIYPGAACDIKSHLYSFSFAPWPEWKFRFGRQDQILAYTHYCVDNFGLKPHIRTSEAVVKAEWQEAGNFWRVTTNAGNVFETTFLLPGTGPLNKAKFPAIPGRESFEGMSFHSSAWPQELDYAGKRIAVVGTGASAIQLVPAIAEAAGHVTVFQRTPPWVIHRKDRPISERKRALFRRQPWRQKLQRELIYWTNEFSALGFVVMPGMMKYAAVMAKSHIRKQIPDPELRSKVTPSYTMGCKRVLRSDDYYPALMREDITLETTAVSAIEPGGLRTEDGKFHPADLLVYATGFEASDNMAPFEIIGRGGISLQAQWQHGGESYLGTSVAGFPNLFTIIGPNTGLGHNSMIHVIESQISYILSVLKDQKQRNWHSIEVKKAVSDQYNSSLQRKLSKTIWSKGGCMSWYINEEGKNTTLWPGFTFTFRRKTRKMQLRDYTFS